MTSPPASPRGRRALLGAALFALGVGFVLYSAFVAPRPINRHPYSVDPSSVERSPEEIAQETEELREYLRAIEPYTIKGKVRCRSPMFTQSGEIGSLFVAAEYPFSGIERHDGIRVYDQTAHFSVVVGEREGALALKGGDMFMLTWLPAKAGDVVDCTSIRRISRSVKVSGTVRFPSGEVAPRATIVCGPARVLSDVSGGFSFEPWLSLDGTPCELTASYNHFGSEVRGEAVELSLRSAHDGLSLTIPEYPLWTPPEGTSPEEACRLAARVRAYWREERRPRSLADAVTQARHHGELGSIVEHIFRPAHVAEANLALSRMPPPCDEEEAGR